MSESKPELVRMVFGNAWIPARFWHQSIVVNGSEAYHRLLRRGWVKSNVQPTQEELAIAKAEAMP